METDGTSSAGRATAVGRRARRVAAGPSRCPVPPLPMGGHAGPMREGADRSPRGLARLAGEFLERLDLRDVTLVGNDTRGALVQLLRGVAADRPSPPGPRGRALLRDQPPTGGKATGHRGWQEL